MDVKTAVGVLGNGTITVFTTVSCMITPVKPRLVVMAFCT